MIFRTSRLVGYVSIPWRVYLLSEPSTSVPSLPETETKWWLEDACRSYWEGSFSGAIC